MRVYNTMSRQKEEFNSSGTVRMYVCGITPYDESHLGHAMSYIVFDVVRRYLEFRGFEVKYVQNFTDIDDKIIDRANARGVPIAELTSKYIDGYLADQKTLNVKPADINPRATQEIPQMIEVIQVLVDKGYAYASEGSVYFRVNRFPAYGALSGRKLSDMEQGHQGPLEQGKEHHLDFALWKASKPGEPYWESPWGQGRPGWHIECTAMAIKYLGTMLDIHGGGLDLVFPHHENETAQSVSYTGVSPFARFWMHNGMVQVGEEKMSKSLGNLVTVRQLLESYSPDAIRLFISNSHYRSPLTYSEDSVQASERGMERLRQAANRGGNPSGQALDATPGRQRFIEAMDDDFNTPQALAALFDLAREINRAAEEGGNVSGAQETLRGLSGILGFTLAEPKACIDTRAVARLLASLLEPLKQAGQDEIAAGLAPLADRLQAQGNGAQEALDRLVQVRASLRKARQWQLADSIRSGLAEIEITLEDTPQGTVWRWRKQG